MKLARSISSGCGCFLLALLVTSCGGQSAVSSDSSSSGTGTGTSVAAEAGSIELAVNNVSVKQAGGSLQINVTRSNGATGAVGVSYATGDGTAVAGSDFTATSGTLSWADADTATKTISVPISNAAPFNSTKTFALALSAATGGAALATPSSATATIDGSGAIVVVEPKPAGTLEIVNSTYAVAQNAGSVKIMVTRSNGSFGPVGVSYTTADGTAKSSTEYSLTTGMLNWAAGDTTAKTISIPISNSAPFTGAKSFSVTLSAPTDAAVLGDPHMTSVTINGDAVSTPPAAGTLEIAATAYSVGQSAGNVSVGVTRSNGSAGAVSISYATSDGTAKSGANYTATSGIVNWASNDTAVKMITVPVSNATPFVGAKSFTVTLSGPSGTAKLGNPSSSAVTINGDGTATPVTPPAAGSLEIAATAYSAAQNAGSIGVAVSRSNGSSGAVSVSYTTGDGSAVSGANYTKTSGVLKWAAGDAAAKVVSIPLSNAVPFVGSKAFTLTISAPAGGATLGSPTSASLSIVGDGTTTPVVPPAAGTLAIGASTYAVSQGAGSILIGVTRSKGSSGAVSVGYASSDGTAKSGANYTGSSGKLQWAAGDTATKTLSVPISNAVPFVGSKSFSLTLAGVTGSATLGSPNAAVITIIGDGKAAPPASAGTLAFPVSTYTVSQSSATINVTVARTSGSAGAVGVQFATSDGTAKAGTDYTAAQGSLSWAAADTASKTIAIAIRSANPFTGAKSFNVTLSSITGGATMGTLNLTTVTINGTGVTTVSGPTTPMGQSAAARLLMQGTMGATTATLNTAAGESYNAWFASQTAAAPSLTVPKLTTGQDWSQFFWDNAVYGQDQLRQRVALALSEIFVVSGSGGPLWGRNDELSGYYDLLVTNAFGNFRTLLQTVTLSPAMGEFLAMMKNDKPNLSVGRHADQNFAREIMQLFTVGLVKLNLDGSVQTDSAGNPLPTYSQDDVDAMSNVMTGWGSGPAPANENGWLYSLNGKVPMIAFENHHDTDAKTIIGGVQVPAGGTAEADLKIALDTLFNHPNVGPFITKQLIQRLVTSNPSAGYVQRVASVFNNNGSGVRGDLLAVTKAILTDPEAVNSGGTSYGRLREPILRLTNIWRAFNASNSLGRVNEFFILNQGGGPFGEYVLQSPTVFNFFRPDYQRSGVLLNAGLVAPEFQITNEFTLVSSDNVLQGATYQFVDSSGTVHAGSNYQVTNQLSSTSVLLHTAAWESLAANPGSMIDQMNLVLMGGQMSSAMRTSLVSYASAIPASSAGSRVIETADLIMSSPQAAVQR